ncbi:MAG: cytochrome c [Gammaproteobacteria bacterium]|nr:cytochrome c [Gammaproteobacteria bacterium]MBU2057488.1 cytochrome c [Gammaproteobacteria bacterium]MBU2176248.1 cytochrome c [Gammaproteobacteria bacterium]MBU2245849.1 cytochrome c [Gammaproteobacteria bacterium]MBU2343123.1 cytochrome c [Gammaproteobacteria bacterium]
MRFMPLIVLVLIGLSAPAMAQDAAVGKTKAAVCAACHGAEGVSVIPDYPNLAGQKVKYLESSIKAYRDGQRKHAVMSPMAAGLSDADILDLAAYFAALPAKK